MKGRMGIMKISDLIAGFICDMLMDGGGIAEIQRKELANRFSCVPSQINYVIETRFSPENGYLVESRRGGGGYIRIMRVIQDKQSMLLEAANSFGDSLSLNSAASIGSYLVKCGALSQKQAKILLGAVSDRALSRLSEQQRDQIRAGIFKYGLLALILE